MEHYYEKKKHWGRDTIVELRNARFIDVEYGRLYDTSVRLLLQGNRIIALPGLYGEPTAIMPDISIDLGGRYVSPALINTHVHVQSILPSLTPGVSDLYTIQRHANTQIDFSLQDCLAHGITVIRDGFAENINLNREIQRRIDTGDLSGPRVIQSIAVSQKGGPLAPDESISDRFILSLTKPALSSIDDKNATGVVVFKPDASKIAIVDAVNRAIDDYGAETIKIFEQREQRITCKPGATIMTQMQLDTIAGHAHKQGIPVAMHSVTVESFRRAVRAGVSSIIHLPIDGHLDEDTVNSAANTGIIVEPSVSAMYDYIRPNFGNYHAFSERYEKLETLRNETNDKFSWNHWVAPLAQIAAQQNKRIKSGKTRFGGIIEMENAFRFYSGMLSYGVDNLRTMLRANVDISLGNDAGAIPKTPAMLNLEAQTIHRIINSSLDWPLVTAGDILRAGTHTASRALGIDSRYGSLETGKSADLAIYDENPLENASVIGSPVAALFKNGELVIDTCGLETETVYDAEVEMYNNVRE